MPDFATAFVILREYFARRHKMDRILVMDNPENVVAYAQAGKDLQVMAAAYLFHGANMCEIIRPGDRVIDLACGPANQLALVAQLNPHTEFIGIDLSDGMLEQARLLCSELHLTNINFQKGDITDLSAFEDHSIDAVVSTLAFHHLPNIEALHQTFKKSSES